MAILKAKLPWWRGYKWLGVAVDKCWGTKHCMIVDQRKDMGTLDGLVYYLPSAGIVVISGELIWHLGLGQWALLRAWVFWHGTPPVLQVVGLVWHLSLAEDMDKTLDAALGRRLPVRVNHCIGYHGEGGASIRLHILFPVLLIMEKAFAAAIGKISQIGWLYRVYCKCSSDYWLMEAISTLMLGEYMSKFW